MTLLRPLAAFIALMITAHAADPDINYQGRLVESGVAVTATRTIQCSIMSGTVAAWTGPSTSVTVTDGLYALPLTLTGITPAQLGAGNLKLRVKITNASNVLTTLTPDITLLPALSAYAVVDGGVTSAAIASNAITGAKILDGTITNSDLASNSVTGSKIATGTITSSDLAVGAATTAVIADNSITSTKIVDGAITGNDLASNAVTGSKIANGTITAADIAPGVIAKWVASCSGTGGGAVTANGFKTLNLSAFYPSLSVGATAACLSANAITVPVNGVYLAIGSMGVSGPSTGTDFDLHAPSVLSCLLSYKGNDTFWDTRPGNSDLDFQTSGILVLNAGDTVSVKSHCGYNSDPVVQLSIYESGLQLILLTTLP